MGKSGRLAGPFHKLADTLWRTHSCVPRRDSSRCSLVSYTNSEECVETSLDAARMSAHATFYLRNYVQATVLVVFCIFGLNAQDHVGKPVPNYVTGDECLFCHRVKVADTWQQNPHARTVWPNEKGDEFIGAKLARPLRKAGYGKFDILNVDKKNWDKNKFADRCAGCHTTAVDPETKAFSATALDCYTCHGVADPNHTKDTTLMRFSSKYPKNAQEIVSVCGSCHLRGGKSRSSGLPYPNNFAPGDDLFRDFDVDLSQADNDRHVFTNVRDVLKNGSTVTCLNCHAIHTDSSTKHKRVLTSAICQDCHNAEGPKSVVKKYEVHSALCEY